MNDNDTTNFRTAAAAYALIGLCIAAWAAVGVAALGLYSLFAPLFA